MKFLGKMIATTLLFWTASAFSANYCGVDRIAGGDDWIPWPWGSEIKIPWTKVNGVWSTVSGDCDTYFIFKASKPNPNGERFTKITQYDPYGCKVISEGYGFEGKNVIRARMIGQLGTYDLTIHAFNESDIRNYSNVRDIRSCTHDFITRGSIIAIRMYPLGNEQKGVTYEVTKLKSSPTMVCE